MRKSLLTLMLLSLSALAYADTFNLECNIVLNDFTDHYSVEVDFDKNMVISTYHAASNKDNSVTIDYIISSEAHIDDETIIYKAKLHSLDYTFSINRKTLMIIRYTNDPSDDEAGRGSCATTKTRDRNL